MIRDKFIITSISASLEGRVGVSFPAHSGRYYRGYKMVLGNLRARKGFAYQYTSKPAKGAKRLCEWRLLLVRTQERNNGLQNYRNHESANTLARGCAAGQVIAHLIFRTLDSLRGSMFLTTAPILRKYPAHIRKRLRWNRNLSRSLTERAKSEARDC